LYPKLNSVDPNAEISSLFENVDRYIVKEFTVAENRMHSLNIFNASLAKACINKINK
jgi:hypothetical protein